MKCVGIQYLETIRRYIKEGLTLKRTVHLSFVPGNALKPVNEGFVWKITLVIDGISSTKKKIETSLSGIIAEFNIE